MIDDDRHGTEHILIYNKLLLQSTVFIVAHKLLSYRVYIVALSSGGGI